MILVVCALLAEIRDFAPRAGVEILATGVGPVEAGLVTTRRLATGGVHTILNAGIGGAWRGRARIGDSVLVTAETFADFGLECDAPLALPAGAALVERAFADAALAAACARCTTRTGSGITVTAVTTSAGTGARRGARYGADVESMEGFAVLRAAAVAGIPAVEVRGISNYVGERDGAEWNFASGAWAATHALEAIVDKLARREG